MMNALFATIRTSFKRQLTYRAANLSGLATNLMFGFFQTAVFSFKRQDVSASQLIHSLSEKYRISDLEVHDQPIEDTIREIYENHLLYN